MNQRRFSVLFILGLVWFQSVFAQRTAMFPPELRSRTAVWLDQDRVFANETVAEQERPIWIHGGDSLSSGWSDGPSLNDKLKLAETKPLPVFGGIADELQHLPDYGTTWYAGANFNYGVLGFLDRLTNPQNWVVISTALAGATLSHNGQGMKGEDPLGYILQVKNPERVRLITFSLGSNDVCDKYDPAADPEAFKARLKALPQKFPRALIIPFKVISVEIMRKTIMDRLQSLPDTPGRARLVAYCQSSWSSQCPGSLRTPDQVEPVIARMQRAFDAQFGGSFDALGALMKQEDVLDLISDDCFHPSAVTEAKIAGLLSRMIAARRLP